MDSQLEIAYRPDVLEGTSVLHLKGTATYKEAPELRRQVFSALGALESGRLVVELEEVDRMDTAAMAVLVEGLLASRGPDGPHLFFCTPSDSVKKVFNLAGLDEALQRCFGCLGEVPEMPPVDCGC
jgi:anti-anti-sigma factor